MQGGQGKPQKPKTPTGIHVLRGISITITVIVILILGSVVYSAYEDYQGVTSTFSSSGSGRVLVVQQGSAALVSLNISLPNKGLYALNLSVTCDPSDTNIVCQPAQVSVSPGGQETLRFHMTITNYAAYLAQGNHAINGTVEVELVPFTSLSVGVNLASLVGQGGA